MTATNDPADPAAASPNEPMEAQFGPHRFHAGEGGGSEQFRGARLTSRTCAEPGSLTVT
jgi:hypothetical protein